MTHFAAGGRRPRGELAGEVIKLGRIGKISERLSYSSVRDIVECVKNMVE